MKRFAAEPMLEIFRWLNDQLKSSKPADVVAFEVLDPDRGRGKYAGERVTVGGREYRHRGYKAWNDLAELLFCRMLTPKVAGDDTVLLRFEKLDISDSFHKTDADNKEEKYGVGSRFFSIDKTEEPAFLAAYLKALESVGVGGNTRVLNLGINTGDEFHLIKETVDAAQWRRMELVGVDHSRSAIAFARERFLDANVSFYVHDINRLDELGLGRFDLLISIGTLQSPGIEFKPLLMSLVQNFLSDGGAVILGFPNCRWMGGEAIYGAKAPNYVYPEQSLLYKDVHFCKKYLQQKKFRVTLTGKNYLFLTATPIGRKSRALS